MLALRDGDHTGSIDLGPGAPRYWISLRGKDGERIEPERASVFEAVAAPELPPSVPFCGVEGDALDASRAVTSPLVAQVSGPAVGQKHMEIAVDTDYEFFQLFGDATEAAAYLVARFDDHLVSGKKNGRAPRRAASLSLIQMDETIPAEPEARRRARSFT